MREIASQITCVSIVSSIVCSGGNQRKHQSSVSLAFVWGIHWWPVNSLHTGPFVRGIHRPMMDSSHKGQWRGALVFSLFCTWTNAWANNQDDGDLRRHPAHYDVIVMFWIIATVSSWCPRHTALYGGVGGCIPTTALSEQCRSDAVPVRSMNSIVRRHSGKTCIGSDAKNWLENVAAHLYTIKPLYILLNLKRPMRLDADDADWKGLADAVLSMPFHRWQPSYQSYTPAFEVVTVTVMPVTPPSRDGLRHVTSPSPIIIIIFTGGTRGNGM